MIRRRAICALTVALAALLLSGCIFSPRDPDGPPEGEQTPWETPITTFVVLTNLTAAYEDENPQNYRDCFTDDFVFNVDPSDSSDAGPEAGVRYADWTVDDEEQAASNAFALASDISLSFTNVLQPNENDDETYRQEDYVLTVAWQSGPHMDEEITYKGRATLHMRKEDGRWAIFRWVDRRVVEPQVNETWGIVRGDFRN